MVRIVDGAPPRKSKLENELLPKRSDFWRFPNGISILFGTRTQSEIVILTREGATIVLQLKRVPTPEEREVIVDVISVDGKQYFTEDGRSPLPTGRNELLVRLLKRGIRPGW